MAEPVLDRLKLARSTLLVLAALAVALVLVLAWWSRDAAARSAQGAGSPSRDAALLPIAHDAPGGDARPRDAHQPLGRDASLLPPIPDARPQPPLRDASGFPAPPDTRRVPVP